MREAQYSPQKRRVESPPDFERMLMSRSANPIESAVLGVQLGALIETAVFDRAAKAIWTAFEHVAQRPSEHAVLASSAWNNVGYRTRSASEHRDAFSRLFGSEPAASHEQRYEQNHHFFGFVTNAVAAAESLTFAVYVVLLGKSGVALADGNLRATRAKQLQAIRAEASFSELGDLLEDQLKQVGSWWEMRDVLMHRGSPTRNHYVGGAKHMKSTLASNPKAVPEQWENDFVSNARSCDDFADWLRKLILDAAPLLERALV